METSKNSSHNVFAPFLESFHAEYPSENTVAAYEYDFKDFARWYAHTTGEDLKPELVTELDLAEYRQYLMRKYKPSTVNRRLAAISKWLKWANKEGILQRIPEMPKQVRQEKLAPRALTRSEQNALLRAVMREGKLRDQAIVYVLMYCGLRIGELVRLRVEDVELKRQGKITVRNGKGDKTREVPAPANVRKVLQEYLGDRTSGRIFLGQRGPLTVRGVQEILAKYAYKARIECLSPHTLRHTCATNLLNKGVDLVKVAAILGHENLNITAVYTRPSFDELKKAVDIGDQENN
ncbi:tyrosine-type recombinase/integrase [Moorella naiadis]|uniref:tyrosine-type recombinase/integrase n=1 Tax=Moorella naiadis (nom. illeg.) TaxID=3093670 RepID=UPI003D9C8B95